MHALVGSEIYEFGEYRLDAKSRRLTRGEQREAVRLTPKAIEVLLALVRGDGRVVTKEELFETIWGGAFIEDANLSQSVFLLRKALNEKKGNPKYILTLSNRGYQFIAEIKKRTDTFDPQVNEHQRFVRRGTANTAAHEAYVKGRYFWNKRTGESLRKAVGNFENAIRLDPNFVQAYAGLADSHQLLADYYKGTLSNLSIDEAKSAARKSQEIDEQLSEAHTSLAYAQAFYDWDWDSADRSFRHALELDPQNANAHHWYSDFLGVLGRFEESYAHITTAIELDPASAVIANGLSAYYYAQRDPERLIAQAERVLELDPASPYGFFYLGFGYEFAGKFEQAVDSFALAAEHFGEPKECGEELRSAFRRNGMDEVWRVRLQQYANRPHLAKYPTYLKSLVPIRLGDHDTTLEWLKDAFEQRDRGIIYAKFDPFLKPLRTDPRFRTLLRQMGLGDSYPAD